MQAISSRIPHDKSCCRRRTRTFRCFALHPCPPAANQIDSRAAKINAIFLYVRRENSSSQSRFTSFLVGFLFFASAFAFLCLLFSVSVSFCYLLDAAHTNSSVLYYLKFPPVAPLSLGTQKETATAAAAAADCTFTFTFRTIFSLFPDIFTTILKRH